MTTRLLEIVTFAGKLSVTAPLEADTETSFAVPARDTTPSLTSVNVPPSTFVLETDKPVPAATEPT